MSHRLFSRIALALAAVGLVVVGAAGLAAPQTAVAAAGINQQINFQGRLLNNAGAVVSDGTYNMRFKIYCDGDGVLGGTDPGSCTAHATNEHLLWTETHQNSASQGVVVKNGYFSVQLGAITSLSSVDFNQTTLWLSMDVTTNGTDTGGSPTYNGEMSPFKRLSSATYAMNANQLQGMSASAFAQLAASTQTFTGTNTFSNAAGIVLSGTPASGGSLLQVGGALSSGSSNGTLIGTNPGSFIGDMVNLQVANSTKLKLTAGGDLTVASTITTQGVGANTFSGQLVVSGVSTDITTGSGEDLTLVASGAGVINLNDTVKVGTLGGVVSTSAAICRDTSATTLTACDVSNTSGRPILQGGNNITTAMDIGTNSGQVLNFRTDGSTKLTVTSTTGDLVFASGVGSFDQSASSGTFKTGTGAVSLNGSTTVTGNLAVTSAATTSNSLAVTANSLSSGSALKVTSTNNSGANTAWSANLFNVTNAQATTAVSTGQIAGLDVQFAQTAGIVGNTETVANLAVAANGGPATDSTVSSILNLTNNDTATGNQIVVTDALKVGSLGGSGSIVNGITLNGGSSAMTNGINFSGTFGGNLINSGTFNVSQAGNVSTTGTLAVSGDTQFDSNILLGGYLNTPYGGVGQYGNLLVNSEQLDLSGGTPPWTPGGTLTVTADNTTAPDGTTSAERLAGTGSTTLSQTYTTTTPGTYTFSVWLKQSSGAANTGLCIFAAGGATPSACSATAVTPSSSAWQRFSVTTAVSGTTTSVTARILPGNGSTATVYAWGAQLVRASSPLVYTRTGGTVVDGSQGLVGNGGLQVQGTIGQATDLLRVVNGAGNISVQVTSVGTLFAYTKPTTTGTTGALEVGSAATQSAGDINGVIGFAGYGVAHGQIAYSVGDGFYLCNSSTGSPSADYGQCSSRVNLYAGTADFNTGLTVEGASLFQPTSASTTTLNVKTPTSASNGNVFTVDTTNSRVGISLGGTNLPQSTLHVTGTFRLDGTPTEDFTTPVGSNVLTKIHIPLYDQSDSAQLLALGVTSGSPITARGISLFDRRGWNGSSYVATLHQPTLSVFSPDENSVVGLSWDGSNSVAALKTMDDTGASDALMMRSGQSSNSGVTTGAVWLQSGDGTGTNTSTGNVVIDSGAKTGSGTAGSITLGGTNATVLTLGHSGATVTVDSDLVLTKRTDSGGGTSDWAVADATAGTPCGQASVDTVKVSAVYNGSLYVGTSESNAAEVCRYDGGTSWTRVNPAAGTFGSQTLRDTVSAMTVFNGYLYIGVTESAGAAVYRYDGGTTWTIVNSTPGTFQTVTSVDGVTAMAVYQGELVIGTSKSSSAQVLRYTGGTTWMRLNTTAGTFEAATGMNTVTTMAVYNTDLYIGTAKTDGGAVFVYMGGLASGAAWANVGAPGKINNDNFTDEVSAMAVYNGCLYISIAETSGGNIANILRYTAHGTSNPYFEEVNTTAGTFGSQTNVDFVKSMAVYGDSLYIGTQEANAAGVYRYDGVSTFTLTNSAAGTFQTTTNIDGVNTMVAFNGRLYMGTSESNNAEFYSYSRVESQSRSLIFNASSDNAGSTEQAGFPNAGSIFFAAETGGSNGIQSTTGSFIFSHSIITATAAYDVAEDYPTRDDSLAPGDVVAIDPHERGFVRKASGPYDSGIVGIYSAKPALHLSQADGSIDGGQAIPVALAGRVPLKVSNANGAILPGDPLTSSVIPGVAMKATGSGRIVGMAMEGYDKPEVGTITTFVNPNFYSSVQEIQGATQTSNLVVDGTLATKDLSVSGTAAITTLTVTGVATVATLNVTGVATVGSLVAAQSVATAALTVTGDAKLANVTVAGNLELGGGMIKSFSAATDLKAGQVVVVAGNGLVGTTTTVGDTKVMGIVAADAAAGQPVKVVIGGTATVQIEGSVAAGDLLGASGTAGKAAKLDPTPAGAMLGKALTAPDEHGQVQVIISLH